MIRGVIFDLGWTLMYYDGDSKEVNPRASKALASFLVKQGINVNGDFPALFQAAREAHWKLADETSIEHPVAEALCVSIGQCGLTVPPADLVNRAVRIFFEEHEQRWRAYGDAVALVQELNRRGLRVGLFSNSDDDGLVQNCVANLGFKPYLDPSFSSAMTHRLRKPNPQALGLVSSHWSLPPDEIVMVGDSPRYDVLGAHRAGMRAILIDHDEGFAWQKIPEGVPHDPAMHADVIVKSLAAIPHVLSNF
jgi:FMN phosphatase YigB (HAD superfamily)